MALGRARNGKLANHFGRGYDRMEPHHRCGLERLYFTLKAAYGKHRAQHDEIVSEAPNADDLMAYLTAYTSAMTK
jgi:hypothetical protein